MNRHKSRAIPFATTYDVGMTKPPSAGEMNELVVASLLRRTRLTEAEAGAAAPVLIDDLKQAGVVSRHEGSEPSNMDSHSSCS